MRRDTLTNISNLDPSSLGALDDDTLVKLAGQLLEVQSYDRQSNQLRYYQPVSPIAESVHYSLCNTIGIGGGNGSSKTETALVEMVIRATGQIPLSLRDRYPRTKLRGPIACRVVCESLTTTLAPIILPKLHWQRWSGVDSPGGRRGHWGWIPRSCLIKGEWKNSWTERTRTLRLFYRDPDEPAKILGESIIQFMSYDQDPSDFASGDFHFILHDEPPKYDIWRENRARVMRVAGTLMIAMTWPDDPAIPCDWIFDEVYEKAQPGPNRDPQVEWYNLYTTDNLNLNQDAVAQRAAQMSQAERATRIFGRPIRMGNRVHPLFTDVDHNWCFHCREVVILGENALCSACNSETVTFNHVQPITTNDLYPVVQLLDPHPRKPHCLLWVQIDPADDWHVVEARQVDGAPEQVREVVDEVEQEYCWSTVRRLMDPNMGRSPASVNRETTWQDSFAAVGLHYDLADDSEVGRKEIDSYLQPDIHTRKPRILVDPRCAAVIYQMKRYLWDDYKKALEKGQKQVPKDKHDDFPALLKYLANSQPNFRALKQLGSVYHRPGTRGRLGY